MEFHDLAPKINLAHAQTALGSVIGQGFGEVFVESTRIESLAFDQGRLASNQLSSQNGVGLRRVIGTETTYAHAESLTDATISELASSLGKQAGGTNAGAPSKQASFANHSGFYTPTEMPALPERIALLEHINVAVRDMDPRVTNVTITLASSIQRVAIIGLDGAPAMDERPMSRIGISVTVDENGRREGGNAGKGGRYDLAILMDEVVWTALAREAIRIALVNLTARPTPAGEQALLLGPGWPGVLFHEAVGHGLEGDFNRRKSSAFSELMGKQVAAKGVRVIDDGTLGDARGSLHVDDEGHKTQRNVLIDDGVLTGYMHDKMNGDLMGTGSTGNCRRQGYDHPPMPRMTNTFLDAGTDTPEELRDNLKDGIHAVGFGGGQVDITSGKFVFNCTEAYYVKNGEVQYPVKGATLIGDGPTALHKIVGIGNDLSLDPGIGNCGKAGQWVPVTVGQPSVLMEGITIGGTEL